MVSLIDASWNTKNCQKKNFHKYCNAHNLCTFFQKICLFQFARLVAMMALVSSQFKTMKPYLWHIQLITYAFCKPFHGKTDDVFDFSTYFSNALAGVYTGNIDWKTQISIWDSKTKCQEGWFKEILEGNSSVGTYGQQLTCYISGELPQRLLAILCFMFGGRINNGLKESPGIN